MLPSRISAPGGAATLSGHHGLHGGGGAHGHEGGGADLAREAVVMTHRSGRAPSVAWRRKDSNVLMIRGLCAPAAISSSHSPQCNLHRWPRMAEGPPFAGAALCEQRGSVHDAKKLRQRGAPVTDILLRLGSGRVAVPARPRPARAQSRQGGYRRATNSCAPVARSRSRPSAPPMAVPGSGSTSTRSRVREEITIPVLHPEDRRPPRN